MIKVLIITECDDCCFFDNEYYEYNETCKQLDRTIETVDGTHPIPKDCPLPTTDFDN